MNSFEVSPFGLSISNLLPRKVKQEILSGNEISTTAPITLKDRTESTKHENDSLQNYEIVVDKSHTTLHNFTNVTEPTDNDYRNPTATDIGSTNNISRTSLCSVDKFIEDLKEKLKENAKIKLEDIPCSSLVKVNDGIILGNETKTVLKTLRSSNFGEEIYRRKRETVRHSDIYKILSEECAVKETGKGSFNYV